jgi:carboxypeptidase Taq
MVHELETAMFDGTLRTADLPRVYFEKSLEYFGPSAAQTLSGGMNFKDGCMSHAHWAQGRFGHASAFIVGHLYAAQFAHAIRQDLGTDALDAALRRGDLRRVTDWLRERVWAHGSRYTTPELLVLATGEPLNASHFKAHIVRRYLNGDMSI